MDTSKNGDFLRYGDVNAALADDFGMMKFWASPAAFETGEGFRGQIIRHLTDQRGEGAVDDPVFGAWAQGYGLSQKLDSCKGIAGLSGSTTSLSAGWDAQVENVVVGIAAGYSLSNLGGHNDRLQRHLTGYQIGYQGTIGSGYDMNGGWVGLRINW